MKVTATVRPVVTATGMEKRNVIQAGRTPIEQCETVAHVKCADGICGCTQIDVLATDTATRLADHVAKES